MTVKNALLGLLAQRPRHGYDLYTAFVKIAGGDGNWELKPAQVYSTLERLEEAGLVARASDLGEGSEPSRRVYAITEAGRQAVEAWFASGEAPDHQRDAFYVKLMVSLASGVGSPYRILIAQRSFIFQRLHAVTNRRNQLDSGIDLAQVMLLDKAIMHLEADLRWLDMIETRLDEIERQPRPEAAARPRGRPKKASD
ncbi:MAG: PadR family transcriptional regulator [Chloroflexi bacterium]|nr:PadR family transcriptional regulator [Chloroflexota bacterium]